jgi:2-dehydrotetronate isomerase
MAGILPPEARRAQAQATYAANLRWAAGEAQKQGVQVLIEPINPRDMPRYFLNRQDHAHEIVEALNLPNLKVQMDLYHCQITEGDLTTKLRQYLPSGRVAHLQIAGVPGRHEPDVGEVNYAFVLAELQTLIAQTGWDGWIGCEYRPARGAAPGSTQAGLAWLAAWQIENNSKKS